MTSGRQMKIQNGHLILMVWKTTDHCMEINAKQGLICMDSVKCSEPLRIKTQIMNELYL